MYRPSGGQRSVNRALSWNIDLIGPGSGQSARIGIAAVAQLSPPEQLQVHQREVTAIGARLPRGMRQSAAPRGLAHLRVGQAVLQCRLLLGGRVGGPYTLRPAKIGDAGIGRDAGPGQYDDARGRGDPGPDDVDGVGRLHVPAHSSASVRASGSPP
jgi:hypothetical protein